MLGYIFLAYFFFLGFFETFFILNIIGGWVVIGGVIGLLGIMLGVRLGMWSFILVVILYVFVVEDKLLYKLGVW